MRLIREVLPVPGRPVTPSIALDAIRWSNPNLRHPIDWRPMRAAFMYGAGDVRVENVPDPIIVQPDRRDRARRARLHLRQRPAPVPQPAPTAAGHADGPRVHRRRRGRSAPRSRPLAVGRLRRSRRSRGPTAPATSAARACTPPAATAGSGTPAASAAARPRPSACRWPTARWSRCPVAEDPRALPSLLTLSDVYGTGYHAAFMGGVTPRPPSRSSATARSGCSPCSRRKQLGAERIILMGRHTAPHRPRAASSAPPTWSPSAAPRASPRSAT